MAPRPAASKPGQERPYHYCPRKQIVHCPCIWADVLPPFDQPQVRKRSRAGAQVKEVLQWELAGDREKALEVQKSRDGQLARSNPVKQDQNQKNNNNET